MWLLPGAPAGATDSGWIKEGEEPVTPSSAGIEDINANPLALNLCEGTGDGNAAILSGGDPPWARFDGNHQPDAPFTFAEGQILPDEGGKTNPFLTETDNFVDHWTKDINAFVTFDKPYRWMLGSGNFGTGDPNERAQLEVEWERGGVPKFAFPGPGDRIAVWGNHIWDCGHDDGGIRSEIHPPVGWVLYRNTANTVDLHGTPREEKRHQDPWVWYESDDRQGIGATFSGTGLLDTPVQATVADSFFSTWGGQVMDALNGCWDESIINSNTINATCSLFHDHEWAQPMLQQDYTFFIPAPPKPSPDAVMLWGAEDKCGGVPVDPANPDEPWLGPGFPPERLFGDIDDVGAADDFPLFPIDPIYLIIDSSEAVGIGSATCNTIPDQAVPTMQNGQPGIEVTVKAATGGVGYPSNDYIAYAKRWKVAWDFVPNPGQEARTYQVDVNTLHVYDDAEPCTEDGEWLMQLRVNEQWTYPVEGHGDSDTAFYTSGAVDDDKCGLHEADFESYSIDQHKTVRVVPGQDLRVWVRTYDIDFFSNDLLPVIDSRVPLPLASNPQSFEVGTTDLDTEGAHTILFAVTDVTDPLPDPGTLDIGTPQYGPNADTEGVVRVNGSPGHETPITFTAGPSGADGFEFRLWKQGDLVPLGWTVDLDGSDGFRVVMPSASSASGNYTIDFAAVKDYSGRKIVSPRQRMVVQLDNTPPELTVPADFTTDSTSAFGANVTYTVTATDNFPGPVTISCDHPSGSFFETGKNEPQITTVTCTATDAVQNQTVKSFDITVKSPFGYVPDFVLVGMDWVNVGSGVVVQSGNVGAFDQSAGVPTAATYEVVAGPSAQFLGGSQIAGHSDLIRNLTLAGDVFYVDRVTGGNGAVFTPRLGYVPLFQGPVAVPAFAAGAIDLTLSGTATLAAGSYRDVVMGPNALVTLSGGDYYFRRLEVKPGAVVRFSAPTTMHVVTRALIANGATVGPTTSSSVLPREVILYATGTDGPPNNPSDAIGIGTYAVLGIDAYAPNGTLSIGSFTSATGAFIGKQVLVGSNVVLNLDSSFLADP